MSQFRAGPIFYWDVHDRATLIGGHYYSREKEEGRWQTSHRSFGGVEAAAWNRKAEVDVRSLVERHTLLAGEDSTRFRNRIRVSPPGTSAPYAGVEAFVDVHGLRSLRYSAGVRRSMSDELVVDFSYFFEQGRNGTVRNRHVIGTTIHWRDRSKRLDADP